MTFLFQSLDDAKVAYSTIAEGSQCFLISGTVVGPLSRVQARIFSNYNTLFEPSLEGSCSGPARKIAGAEGSSRGRGEFGISREFLGVGN